MKILQKMQITSGNSGKEYLVNRSDSTYCPNAINMVFLSDYLCTCVLLWLAKKSLVTRNV